MSHREITENRVGSRARELEKKGSPGVKSPLA